MATSISDIDLQSLSPSERLLLAQQLVGSVLIEATPLAPDVLAEMERRVAEIEDGTVTCETAEVVCARLLALSR